MYQYAITYIFSLSTVCDVLRKWTAATNIWLTGHRWSFLALTVDAYSISLLAPCMHSLNARVSKSIKKSQLNSVNWKPIRQTFAIRIIVCSLVSVLEHLYLQCVNSITSGAQLKALWYRAACLLIQKKKDIIGTTWSGSDNTLSVKRALGLRHVFKKFLETTVLHKQWD